MNPSTEQKKIFMKLLAEPRTWTDCLGKGLSYEIENEIGTWNRQDP
jgi:hypothetical protein